MGHDLESPVQRPWKGNPSVSLISRNTHYLPVLVVLFIACSGTDTPPKHENAIHVNLGAEVQDLDPHLTLGVPEHRALTALFEGLTNLDLITMQAIPGVAESWTVSEDGMHYTFTLRDTARWSNGDPVTAGDFVYSWKRILSPGLGAEYAYLLHCLKNAKAYNEGTLENFDEVGVKAVDDRSLDVTLEGPIPYFLSMQIHQAWLPVRQSVVEQSGTMDQRGNPWSRAGTHVGNGAYKLVEWRPNEHIRVMKNEHYWNKDAVALEEIYFHPIDNLQTEERSFRTGMLDMTYEVPLHRIAVYRRENPEVLHIDPYFGVYYYRLNVTRPPFTDKRVRQAFSLALNREELTTNVYKADEMPAFSYVPPGVPNYPYESKLEYNVERARTLLAEAGYPNGEGLPPVEILFNTSESHKTIAEAAQRIWKETLNANISLVNQDWKVYLDSMNSLDYSMARAGWIGDVVDPMNFLECFLSYSGNNRTGFNSPEYDALIEATYKEGDPTKRMAMLQDAEDMLLEELPFVPVAFYTRKYLQNPDLKGFVPNVLGYIQWKDLYLEPETP